MPGRAPAAAARLIELAELLLRFTPVDPRDADAVEAAALQLLADPGLRRDMGQRGREAVASKYNWGVEGEKLISFFRELTTAVPA